MNRRELELHLQDLLEGHLEGENLQNLQQELRRNPDARDAYRDYVHLQNALQLRCDGIDLLHVVPMDRVVARRQRRHLRNAVLSAAAVLLVSALVAALIMINQPERGHLTAAMTADTRWTVDGESQDPEAGEWTVSAGSTVRVWSGTVKLRLESGVAMVMQGPALVSFPELDKPVVTSGWLWVDSGKTADPLEVATPELLVRDIGTRFGVRVSDDEPAEVHFIEGKVDVFAKSTQKKIVTLQPEERGFAVTPAGEPVGLELARDPFPELADLLAEPANYPTTVRSQSPAGYWRLEDAKAGLLANEVAEGGVGRRQTKVVAGEPGPGPASGGFHGFAADNEAIQLTGVPGKAPLSLGTTPVHSGILFRDDFNRSGPLHGTRPAFTTNKAKWVAATSPTRFGADGRFAGHGEGSAPNRGGSATLAFKPVDGVVYTLDASLRGVTTKGAWIAVGFADGQSSKGSKGSRFVGGAVTGRAWMLARDGRGTRPNQAWLGASGTTGGTADGSPWAGALAFAATDDLDLRIILDTGGGPGKWTATWLARRPSDRDFTTVRETATLINESITSIGLAVSAGGISGTVESFSLRADRIKAGGSNRQLVAAPAPMTRKEGAVSFWIRRDPGTMRQEILWSAGEAPEDASIHAHLTADGRAGFFMENGRYDVLVTSEDSINDGRWHHVAVGWSPSAVDLHLDGRLVARDTEYRGMQQGILPELRIGAGPAKSKTAPFTGWVDEVALWDRALTPAEVQHQFHSARGR